MSTNNINPDLTDKIKQAIQQELKLTSPPSLSENLIYSDDRKIYKLTVKDNQAFYILKLRDDSAIKEGDLEDESISGEHDKLLKAWLSAKHLPKDYSMSKPVAIWLEEKAILMSGCAGVNLNTFFNQHLLKWTFNITPLKRRLSMAGSWLGQYHQLAGQQQDMQSLAEHRLSHVSRMLSIVAENANTGLTSKSLQQIHDKIQLRFNHCSQDLIGHIHGNFAYRNILCDDNVMNLVDF